MKAGKTIEIAGQITAGQNVVAKSSSGINIIGKADVSAGRDIDLTTGKGDLTIEGKVRANQGAVAIELEEGNIQIGNDTTKLNSEKVVIAKRDINMTTGNGVIKILGDTESTLGNINIKEQKSTTQNNTPANVIETADLIEQRIADILIDAELKANESVWIVTESGDIEVARQITVTNGNINVTTTSGDIVINSNGADDMLSAQNNLNIEALNGAIDIAGKISTKDGDISITSNHETYARRQKGITVEETGAINPGRNLYLNATNGNIEFKSVSANNADVKTINGNVTAETISADDTIYIELEHGDLYLNLAQSKGVAILTSDNSNSTVNTIRANYVDVSDAVKVGRILPYRSSSTIRSDTSSSATASVYSNYSYSNFANSSTLARSSNPYAILGTTLTNGGLTYWQNATSPLTLTPNFYDDRQTRNYFEVRFIPTWLESEFIDIDYSFDHFGIRNATEDELTID